MRCKVEMFLVMDDEGYRAVCEINGEEVARSCPYADPAIALLNVKQMVDALQMSGTITALHENVPLAMQ